jgi:hypothetical protein
MKRLTIVAIAALTMMGCTRNTPKTRRVQINDWPMFISAKPINPKERVTLWYELDAERKALLKDALVNQFGAPPGVTITPPGEKEISMGAVPVTDVRVTRKVSVKQGENLLYGKEDDVTTESLDRLVTWTISSDEWTLALSTDEDVVYSIHYWRSYKGEVVNGGSTVIHCDVRIPVLKSGK